jgi:hypothetical protein
VKTKTTEEQRPQKGGHVNFKRDDLSQKCEISKENGSSSKP